MADIIKTKIKRRNGTSWDTLRPETEVAQIVDIDAYVPDNLQDLDNVVITTPSNGQVLKYNGSNWVNSADSNTNTTYSISAVDSSNDVIIRLSGSDSTNDDIKLVAGSNITLTPSGDNITIAATDTNTTYTLGSFGITATAAELNVLDGITATTTELNYVDGVTSAIQTQLNAKAPLASPALTGTPTAPTAATNTNNTQIATTAFVANKLAGIAGGLNFKGTVSLSTAKNGDNLYGTGSGQISSPGDYLIVSAAGDITNAGSTVITLAAQTPGDEGDETLPITLEVGDWIMYQSLVTQTLTVVILNNNDASKAPAVHNHAASNITSGELNTARMGSGTATAGYVLKSDGDGTASWQVDNNTTYTLGSFGITATATELNYTDGVTSNIQTQLNGKLSTSGKAADSNLLDGIDSSAFLRSDADDYLQSTLIVDQNGNSGNIAYEIANGCYIPRPLGGHYVTTSNSATGSIAIKLPTASWNQSDMISFWVDIYDYAGGNEGETVSIHIYGYQYSTGNWTNTGALVLSDRDDRDYTVRFGHDGTRHIVYIGETNSSWNYPQINVRDFQAGYSASFANYDDAFAVTFETAHSNVQQTSSANYPVAKTAQADPTLTINGDASGSATFTNLGNATLTLTINDDSHNHTIANVDGLQTALDGKAASSHTHSYLPLSGGTLTGTLTTRAIAMQNYDLTGVGSISINDPGPNEGVFFGGNFQVYESPDDLTTNSSGNLQFVSGGARRMTIDTSGNVYANGGSGIFQGSEFRITDSSTRLLEGGGNALRMQTSTGYIDMGSMNSSWAHFETDRARFYFGKPVSINGGLQDYSTGSNYWHASNDGSGSGLDADLLDGNHASAFYLASNPSGYTTYSANQAVNTNSNVTFNQIVANADLYGKYVNGSWSNLYRWGGIYFTWDSDEYGTNTHHSIRSTYGDSYGDNLTMNSFNHIRFNIDSNNNNTGSVFEVGANTTGTGNVIFQVNDSGNVSWTGSLTSGSVPWARVTGAPAFVTSSGVTSVATGGGLTGGTITSTGTISHADTSSQASVNNSGNTFIQDITLDTYGHITGIVSATANNVGNADTVDGYHAVAFVRNVYSEFLDSSFPAAPLTVATTAWTKPASTPSVTLEANSRYYVFCAGSYYTSATTTGMGVSPTFSAVSGQLRGGQIWINTSSSTTAGTSEFTANWRTLSTSAGQTGNFALGTAGPTSNPGNEFGFYGIVETSGTSTVLSMHFRSEVGAGQTVYVNRVALTAMKLPI